MKGPLPKADKKRGIIDFIRCLFLRKKQVQGAYQQSTIEQEIHLEPKYWPEVKHFMNKINDIVVHSTIEDNNIHLVNQRIIDYVEKQINTKGSLEDIEQRYMALNTLADRILYNNLSKIVGLKHDKNSHADFTEAVAEFKRELEKRHQDDLLSHKEDHH